MEPLINFNLVKKLETGKEAHIYYGLYDQKLYIQIATSEEEIVYQAETTVMVNPSPTNLVKAIGNLFPEIFKKSGIKIKSFKEWDGKKIVGTGIVQCNDIQNILPNFGGYLSSYFREN